MLEDTMDKKHFVVVGAGFSGLAAAKTFLKFGHNVTVLEAHSTVGGVWSAGNHYPGVGAQISGQVYYYSDTPSHPPQYGERTPKNECPSQPRILNYMQDYASAQGIMPHIRFNTRLVEAQPIGSADAPEGWTLKLATTQPAGGGGVPAPSQSSSLSCDVLVMATGSFNKPVYPTVEGVDAFTARGGVFVHSGEMLARGITAERLAGKRVLVIGNSRSGMDLAVKSANEFGAKKVTELYRTHRWTVPEYLNGKVHQKYAFFHRFGHFMMPGLRPMGGWATWLHTKIATAHWGSVMNQVAAQFGFDKLGVRPSTSVLSELTCSKAHTAPAGFWEAVHDGAIDYLQTTLVCLDPATPGSAEAEEADGAAGIATLADGRRVPVDVVICATGFKRDVDFLPATIRDKVLADDGSIRMYHYSYPYELGGRSLFACGWTTTFYNPFCAELLSRWIVDVVDGVLDLPPPEKMRDEQERVWWGWMDRHFTREAARQARAGCIEPLNYEYIDDLLRELGTAANWRALGLKGLVKDWFLPMEPSHLKHLLDAIPDRRSSGAAAGGGVHGRSAASKYSTSGN